MPAPSSLRSGASFRCQACKIEYLTEHALIKHSSARHRKDRILIPALGIEGALVQGELQCPRCHELSCTPEAWDYHVNVNHEFEVCELPTCLVRPLFDGNWHQVHQNPPRAISRNTSPPLQWHQCQVQIRDQKCIYELSEGDNEGTMMFHFALSHDKHEIMVPEHGDRGALVQWYIPCPFYPTCPVIFSTWYAWTQRRSITYPRTSGISSPNQLIRVDPAPSFHQSNPNYPPKCTNNVMAAKAGPHTHYPCGQAPHSPSGGPNSQHQKLPSHTQHTQYPSDISAPGCHQSKPTSPPKSTNSFMAAKAGPHTHHSYGQAPQSYSVSHNSLHQQPPSHTQHTQYPSDISSAEHHQQHSGRLVLSKNNPHIPPFTPTPQTSAGIASPQCPNLHQNLPDPQSALSQASQHRPSQAKAL